MMNSTLAATPANTALTAFNAIGNKIASVITYDNATAVTFKVGAIIRQAGHAAFCAIYFVGAFAYYLGQSCGEGRYNVRIAAAELAVENLIGGDTKPVSPRVTLTTVAEFRVVCAKYGIVWRNANGRSKHMTKV